MTELQKRFEADAYKQKMNYAGFAGIAAEQGFLAGIDFLQHLLQQTQCTTLLPEDVRFRCIRFAYQCRLKGVVTNKDTVELYDKIFPRQ